MSEADITNQHLHIVSQARKPSHSPSGYEAPGKHAHLFRVGDFTDEEAEAQGGRSPVSQGRTAGQKLEPCHILKSILGHQQLSDSEIWLKTRVSARKEEPSPAVSTFDQISPEQATKERARAGRGPAPAVRMQEARVAGVTQGGAGSC